MASYFSTLNVLLGCVILVCLVNHGQCDSSILAFPAFASVESNNEQVCSGTVIDHKYVMTSSRCLQKFDLSKDVVNVRLGMDKRGFRGEVVNVASNSSNTQSTMAGNATDMAVLKLATYIRYMPKVAWSNLALLAITEGIEGESPLWLDTKVKSALSSVTLKVMTHSDCVSLYQGILTIDDTMECVQPVASPQLACLVDLGSPFFANEQVFGMVTYPASCDVTPNLPIVISSIPATANFAVMVMTGLADNFQEFLPS